MRQRVQPSLARLQRALRGLRRRALPDERCHLISYPKCGRTWIRFMLARALAAHYGIPAGFELDRSYKAHPDVPRILVTHDDDPHRRRPEEIERDKSKYADSSVILLIRDPRDVLVSMYLQRGKREQSFDGDMRAFVREREGGFDSLLRFYAVWGANLHVPRALLLVRYEDVQADPECELGRIMSFIGVQDVRPEVVQRAIQESSFESMRRLERDGRFASERLRPGDPEDVESYKVRRGKVGGYVDYMDADLLGQVNRRMERRLPVDFGYWV